MQNIQVNTYHSNLLLATLLLYSNISVQNITVLQPNRYYHHIHNAHTCLSLQVRCWPKYSLPNAVGQWRDRLKRGAPNWGRNVDHVWQAKAGQLASLGSDFQDQEVSDFVQVLKLAIDFNFMRRHSRGHRNANALAYFLTCIFVCNTAFRHPARH